MQSILQVSAFAIFCLLPQINQQKKRTRYPGLGLQWKVVHWQAKEGKGTCYNLNYNHSISLFLFKISKKYTLSPKLAYTATADSLHAFICAWVVKAAGEISCRTGETNTQTFTSMHCTHLAAVVCFGVVSPWIYFPAVAREEPQMLPCVWLNSQKYQL